MFEGVIYTIAVAIVLLFVLVAIYFIIVVPNRESKLQEYLNTNQYMEAELLIRSILKKEPNNIKMISTLAELYWSLEQYELSVNLLEKLSLYKKLPSAIKKTVLLRLADWNKKQNNLLEARELLDSLLQIDSHNAEALVLLGDIQLEQKQYSQALVYYKKALSFNMRNLAVWKNMAFIYYNMKMYLDAYKAYSHALNLDNKDPELWFHSGEICELIEDPKKALHCYNKTEQFGDFVLSFKAIKKTATIYKSNHQRLEQIATLEKARSFIKRDTENLLSQNDVLDIHYQLGEYYLADKHIDLALEEWEKILFIDKNYLDVAQKFNNHYTLQLNDFFKDILTNKGDNLIEILADFTRSLDYTIDSIQNFGEEIINFFVSESSSKWRDVRRKKTIISFWCSTDPLPLDVATRLSAIVKAQEIAQVYVLSAGPILSEVRQALGRKFVDAFDQTNIQEFIRERKESSKSGK